MAEDSLSNYWVRAEALFSDQNDDGHLDWKAINELTQQRKKLQKSTIVVEENGENKRRRLVDPDSLQRNRRYNFMQQQIKLDAEYFLEKSMRHRHPYLWEQMCGCFMTAAQKERLDTFDKELPIHQRLLENYELMLENERYIEEKRNYGEECSEPSFFEDNSENESESDNEDNEEAERNDGKSLSSQDNLHSKVSPEIEEKSEMAEDEVEELRKEFMRACFELFLDGKEAAFFDYAVVDNDNSMDSCLEFDQDFEDSYFDSECPS
eukprot:GCRY01001213.1.p1 GENE.GCRY01001213.1~~GCRY01001213.1.p1  ORF type:complete len:265 (+),score=56.17 GCRY01001213.1:916-1710(+)